MNGRAIPGVYLFRLYVCDKEMSWPHHIGETHQPDWVVCVRDSEKFRLTNVIPERIIFVSRGITVFIYATIISKLPAGICDIWRGARLKGVMHVGRDLCAGFSCIYFSSDCVIRYRSVGFAIPAGRRPLWRPRTIPEARIIFRPCGKKS